MPRRSASIYQDDEFGLEVLRGAEAGLKTMNMELAEKTSYKRGATDFSSQVAKLKGSGCELVVLGTIIRETIGTIGEARKTGFNPVFLGSSAAYTELIHKLGGKAMDGLYATMGGAGAVPGRSLAAAALLGHQVQDASYNEDPTVFSAYGYRDHGRLHQGAPPRPGPNLTHRQLHQGHGLDDHPARHLRQRAEATFTATKRLGSDAVAPVADRRRQVEGDLRVREALITPFSTAARPPAGGRFA